MTNAFVTKTRGYGRRCWRCNGECSKNPKFTQASDRGKWNNAFEPQCTECGYKPNPSCMLWGDGLGVNGGKWKKDNHIAPSSSSQPTPSKRTLAQQAANDKRAADKKLHK